MAITINGTGSITGLTAGGLPDGSVDADTLAADAVTVPKIGYNGAILQVQQATKTDASSVTFSAQGQWKDVLSLSITPVAAGSNILIMWYTSVSTAINQRGTARLLRDSTAIGIGDADGNRQRGSHGSLAQTTYATYTIPICQNFLDDPTYTLGDSITYKLQLGFEQSAGTVYINRSVTDSDVNSYHRGSTFIQALEVAA